MKNASIGCINTIENSANHSNMMQNYLQWNILVDEISNAKKSSRKVTNEYLT